MNDKRKVLYEQLSKDYDLGDFDSFSAKLDDENKRKALYDAVSEEYELGDYDSFVNKIAPAKTYQPTEEEVQQRILTNKPDMFKPKTVDMYGAHDKDKSAFDLMQEGRSYDMLEANQRYNQRPITEFGEAFKQGADALYQGGKNLVGETANVLTGSQRDYNRAKMQLDELVRSGYDMTNFDVEKALSDYKDRDYQRRMKEWQKEIETRKGEREDMNFLEALMHRIQDPSRPKSQYEDTGMFADELQLRRSYHAIQDALQKSNGNVEEAYKLLSSNEGKETWGDKVTREAREELAKQRPTEGTAAWIGGMIPQMIGTGAGVAMSFTPWGRIARFLGQANMMALTGSTAGMSMAEARDYAERKGRPANEGDVWRSGMIDAAIEYGTERIPFNRYFNNVQDASSSFIGKFFSNAVKGNGNAKSELSSLLNKAAKDFKLDYISKDKIEEYLTDVVVEGVSELSAEVLQTLSPMIYQNPEDYPTLTEILNNGFEGAKGGLFMGAFLGGGSSFANTYRNRKRREKQGGVRLANTSKNGVVELLGEDEEGIHAVTPKGEEVILSKDDIIEERNYTLEEFENAAREKVMSDVQDNVEADNQFIDSVTDPSTGMYTEVDRLVVENGEMVRQHGYIVGWINDAPVFLAEGLENTQENRVILKPNQWDKDSMQQLPNDRVKAINEEMVREEAAVRMDEESKYAPEVLKSQMQQGVPFDTPTSRIVPISPMPEGNGWVVEEYAMDTENKLSKMPIAREMTTEEYRDIMQAQYEAQQAESAPSESVGEQVNTEVNNPMGNAESTPMTPMETQGSTPMSPMSSPMSEEVQSVTEEKSTQPVIPTKKDGSIDFVAYGREGTLKTLGEKYGEKMPNKVAVTAKALAEDVVKAEEKLAKAEEAYDNAPIGREQKAEQARDKARQELEEVKKEADYWKAIDEEIKEAQKAREAIVNPKVEVDMSDSPQTVDEFVAQQLASGNIVLTSESFKKETGYGEKERKEFPKLFRKAENGGLTIEQAGERLMEMDRENGTNFFDQEDANAGRDAIINMLGSVRSWGDITGYIKNNREQQANRDADGLRNEIEEAIESNYHMTPEDYATLQEMESVENPFGELDVATKDAIFVEAEEEYQSYLNSLENGQGTTEEVAEGNGNVLSEERTDDTGGTSERQGERPDVSEGAVQQNDAAQETEQVKEPLSIQEGESPIAFAERVVEEERRKPLRARAREWSSKLGVKVKIMESLDDVTNPSAKRAISSGQAVTGWFEESTGEVCLYMPNISSLEEVDATYIHEVVSHKGLRGLLGDKFDSFCDEVWDMMSNADRLKFMEYPGVSHLKGQAKSRAAADEYIAFLSENVNVTEPTWNKFTELVKKFLKAIGLEPKMTNADIANTIKKSYQRLLSGETAEGGVSGDGTRFRTLEEINQTFNEELQQQIDGTLPSGHIYQLGSPSAVLRSAGIEDLPIELAASRLVDKSMQDNHPFELSEVENLPEAIHNPLAVFVSATKVGSNVILTELKHGGKNFVAALRVRPNKKRIEVNQIRSLYPKNTNGIIDWINNGLATYVDKGRMVEWVEKQRNELLSKPQSNSVEVREQLASATKIVNSFENPTLPEEKSLFRVVYHGSAASFDKFDHSFMGTGEGNQAYGWGSYVTEVDGIARSYAQNGVLYNPREDIKYVGDFGEYVGERIIDIARSYLIDGRYNLEKAKEYARNDMKHSMPETSRKGCEFLLGTSEDDWVFNYRHHLYEVDIPDDNGYNYLPWNDMLTDEQLEGVRNAMRNSDIFNAYAKKYGRELANERLDNWTNVSEFKYAYNHLQNFVDVDKGADKIISQILSNAGFVGIKYPAEYMSGGRADKAKNYVIFNEDDLQIVNHTRFRVVNDKNGRKTLVGLHNISEDKLRKAIKQGGLANPSMAVIDMDKQSHVDYGDITLVAPESLIDKNTGRSAGTYMGDAWTPVYPKVTMQLDNKGWKKINQYIESIEDNKELHGDMKYGVEDYLDGGRGMYMNYAFLKSKGLNPEIFYKNSDGYVSTEEIKKLLGVEEIDTSFEGYSKLKELPEDTLEELKLWVRTNGNKAKMDEYKKRQEQIKEKFAGKEMPLKFLNQKSDDLGFGEYDHFVYDTKRRERDNGQIDTRKTFSEANYYVAQNGLGAEFDKWMDNLLLDAGAKEVFFAGYTPSGNKKYMANTLENVSKFMNKQSKTNAYDETGFGATKSLFLKKLNTLEEIREQKDKLVELEEYRETTQELSDRMGDLISRLSDMQTISSNKFMNYDYAASRLQEAMTKRNPIKHLNDEYGYGLDKKGPFAEDLTELIKDIKDSPARYFETKFERPVYLNEFAAAVVPQGTSKDVVDALTEVGLPIEEYESGNNEARMAAVDKVSSEIGGIRFRFIGERGAKNLDKAEEATTRLDNLAVAREMEAAEKDAKTIKMATGWERGADGLWRYETMDSETAIKDGDEAEIRKQIEDIEEEEKAYKKKAKAEGIDADERYEAYISFNRRRGFLEAQLAYVMVKNANVLTHIDVSLYHVLDKENSENLFKAYPELEFVRVGFATEIHGKSLGATIVNGSRIEAIHLDVKRSTPEELNGYLAHEIQHAIQEIEGFAPGGDPSMESPRKAEQKSKDISFMKDKLDKSVSERKSLLKQRDEVNDKMSAWWAAHEDATRDDMLADKEMQQYNREYDELSKQIDEADKTVKFNERWLDATLQANTSLGYEGYKKLAGEVEARNVTSRLGMTLEQRRNSLASETEDVARKDQIFLKDGIESGIRFRVAREPAIDYVSQANDVVEVPKDEVMYTMNNIASQLYKTSGRFMRQLYQNGTLGRVLKGDYAEIDQIKAKNEYDHAKPIFDEYLNELVWMKYQSTEAAQEVINGVISDVEYAMQYYKDLALGKDVWRTDEKPRFRIVEKQREDAQKQVDDFTSKYNSKPVVVVDSAMSDEELEKAIPTLLPEDIRVRIENGLIGGYSTIADKIYIFADNVSEDTLEDTLFHENLHPMFKGSPMIEEFYNNFKAKYPEQVEMLSEGYKESEIPEELFVTALATGMQKGNFKIVDAFLSDGAREELGKTLKSFGYDYEQERGRRHDERNNGEGSEVARDKEVDERSGRKEDGEEERTKAEQSEELRKLFERVASEGLRGVVGDAAYDMAMIDIYHALPEKERVEVSMNAVRNLGGNVAAAVDEYLESKNNSSLWDKVAGIIRDVLRKAGFDLDLTENDVKYLLWRSKKPLDEGNLLDLAEDIDMRYRLKVGEYSTNDDGTTPDGGGTRFRTSEDVLNQIKQARKEVEKNPSEAQKEAGNYKKGHISLDGFEITLENPKGGTRSGVDKNGKKWNITMNNDYGYIRGTEAVDGDHIDVFLSDNPTEGRVFVVDQLNEEGFFDESKVMYGFDTLNEARDAYLSNYKKGWEKRIMAITEVSKEEFKKWIDSSYRKTKPFSEYKSVKSENNDIRFRVSNKLQVRDEYEATIRKGGYQAREAVQDAMLSLRRFQDLIEKESGKKIRDFENAWMHENRLSSVVQAAIHEMERKYYKPMMESVKKLMKAADIKQEEVADYLMLKHGIERNREMAVRKALTDAEGKIDRTHLEQWYQDKEAIRNDASLDTWRKKQEAMDNLALNYGADMSRDYSGLTSMFDTDDIEECTNRAFDEVEALENAYPAETEALGKAVKAMTQNTLDESFRSGLMDRKVYDELSKDMYDYYIPLRGFEETTSEEVYAYLDQDRGAFNAPLQRAKGRSSKSDNPIAYLKSIAESGIMQGERNKMKQSFLNMVINHPSDLVSIHEGVWAVYNPASGEWEAAAPPAIPNNATPADVEAAMEAWEQQMEQAAQNDPTLVKKIAEAADVPYRVVGNRMNQHQIIVKRLGKSYTLTVNGNPRLAMALNGLTNPNNTSNDGKVSAYVSGKFGALNRFLALVYTTKNTYFVVSNFMRDTFYTNTIVRAKEGNSYANKFHKHYAELLMPGKMISLFKKYEKGTLDMSNATEAAFKDFMMNGGETGYSNLKDLENIKKQIAKDLKGNRLEVVEKVAEKLDILNRAVENTARFAAYLTSREEGRSIAKSVFDAKEISVNFNKKGAGGTFFGMTGQTKLGNLAAMVGAGGRALYVFFNAAIQGTTNLLHVMKKSPKGTSAGIAAMFLMGAVLPFLLDDDEEKDYYDLPEHVRRNHLILPGFGDAWISIPLPIEYRIMYGMGELLTSWRTGHERGSDIGRKMLNLIGQALPLNFLEEGFDAFIPSSLSPLWQVYNNKSWTGLPLYKDNEFNKDDPEYTKAYKNVDRTLYNVTKALYDWTFDEENQEAGINLNPAVLEALARGYFGGFATQLSDLGKTLETIAGEREFDWRNIPIGNRVFKSGDERTKEKRVTNEYFENIEKLDFMQSRERTLKKTINGVSVPQEDKDRAKEDYERMKDTDIYKKYQEFKKKKKDVDKLRKHMKEKGSTEELEKKLTTLQEEANKVVR